MDDQPNDITAADTATATDEASVEITTGIWIAWANAAADARARAAESRTRGELNNEMANAMTSMCAAAFAMESLSVALARETMPTEAAKWEAALGNRTKAVSRVREVLKRSVTLPGPDVENLASRWGDVIGLRNATVHFGETPSEPHEHPSGVNSSKEIATYTVELADRCASLLLETLHAIRDKAKPALQRWLQLWAGAIPDIELRLNQPARS